MNTFEQLRQEAETRETIRTYRREHPPVDYSRINEVKETFGAKHPGEIDMWRTVWDDFNIDYSAGIPENYLPKAVKGALGLTDRKALDAVSIGKEFDLLIEGDPAKAVNLDYGDSEDDTILRLVGPQERPDLYCEDVEQYADRDKWAKIWQNIGADRNRSLSENVITRSCLKLFSTDTESQAKAAIEVGEMAECIINEDGGYVLSGERPEEYWLDIWESEATTLDDTLSKKDIEPYIAIREGVKGDKALELIEETVERGELYSPKDADDDQLAINDPSSDEGPEIGRKVGIVTDDDDPDDDSNETQSEHSDGDSSDSTAASEDGQTETSHSENGTAGGDNTNSSDGQTANDTTVNSDDSDSEDTTPKEEFIHWKQVREKGILNATIPKDAMLYYALDNGIATQDDIVIRDGKHGEFETLPVDKKGDTLAKIEEEHDFEILWNEYHDSVKHPDRKTDSGTSPSDQQPGDGESGSGEQAESSSGGSDGSGEQQSTGASEESERATSSASESESSSDESQATGITVEGETSDDADDSEADQSSSEGYDESLGDTHDVEEGVATSKLIDGYDGEENSEQNDSDRGAANGSGDGGTTKFQTYEKPDLSTPGINVDSNAVGQFIKHHTTTESSDETTLKTPADLLYDAFTEWAELNEISLDKLDSELSETQRKGNLTQILGDEFGIEKSQRRIDGDRILAYHPITVDDNIRSII